jgi:hypothetical protein
VNQNIKEFRWPIVLLATTTCVLISLIFLYRPMYSVFHDHQYLQAVNLGLGNYVESMWYIETRYGYPGAGVLPRILEWPVFLAGYELGPTALHAVNVLQVSFFLSASLVLGSWALKLLTPLALLVGLSAALTFPYTLDLIGFPVANEETTWLLGGALLAWCRYGSRVPGKLPFVVVVILMLLLIPLVGRSVFLFVPASLTILWLNRGDWASRSRVIFVSVTLLIATFIPALLTLTSDYSDQSIQSFSFGTLKNPGLLVLGALSFGSLFLALVQYWNSKLVDPSLWVLLVLCFSFLFGILFYGIKFNYYLAVLAVPIGWVAMFVFDRLRLGVLRFTSVVFMLGLTLVAVPWRAATFYQPLGSITEFLESDLSRQLNQGGAQVAVTCAITDIGYFASLIGLSSPEFGWALDTPYLFGDSKLCPIEPGPGYKSIWKSEYPNGFTLYASKELAPA